MNATLASAERDALWAEVAMLTREMLEAGRGDEWERVIEMEAQRRELIERFFATPAQASEATALAEAIQELLRIDGELTALVKNSRSELAARLTGMLHGKRAVKAYSDNR